MLHLPHVDLAALGAAIVGAAALFAGLRKRPAAAPVGLAALPAGPARIDDGLTARAAMELIGHEAIVCEAYKDSQRIWTWGIGVTDASGHKVARYIDHPQSVERCLEVYIWLLRAKYLPAVRKAFAGHVLTEAQLAAALSFHYNTGAILTAKWVGDWKAGNIAKAREEFMTWRHPEAIVPRRQKECDLFFDGRWSSDGKASVIPVSKPSYQPSFRGLKRVDVLPTLKVLLGD
jgi:lysozyme